MNEILNQLKQYFNNTPRNVIEEEWNALEKDFGNVGPKIEEFLIMLDEPQKWDYKIPDKELIIETTPNCYNSEFFLPL
ncbi:MAG: hypothetical protein PHR52_12990 [Fermentimonas sp.]|nr:hypothetical protein [Fermentimonas sp.]